MDVQAISDLRLHLGEVLDRITAGWGAFQGDGEQVVTDLTRMLGSPPDLVRRPLETGVTLLYFSTAVDAKRIVRSVTRARLEGAAAGANPEMSAVSDYDQAVKAILGGQVLVVTEPPLRVLAVNVVKWPQRKPSEPPGEKVVQGPHEGFIEELDANIGLIRHRIQDRRLRCVLVDTLSRSHTRAVLLYMDGIARQSMLEAVTDALSRAHPPFVTDATMLGNWISRTASLLMPVHGTTERTDIATAALLQGRVVVLVDGSPVALTLPNTLWHLFHAPDDYYRSSLLASSRRVLRYFGALLALFATPTFIALITVNINLLPQPLFISVAQTRQGVPLPPLAEVLLLESIIEVIREAGLRLPGSLGQPIAVVGAVVIGQSAVMAGLISAPIVVVVSLAFIASFTIPSNDVRMAATIVRFALIVVAYGFGVYGIAWSGLMLIIYLAWLESFGVPYLAPVIPARPRRWQDSFLRLPLWWQRRSFLAEPPGPRS